MALAGRVSSVSLPKTGQLRPLGHDAAEKSLSSPSFETKSI